MASFPTSYLPDDEEEQRLAEIERITGGFGTEFAAGMAAGGIDIGAGDPEPVDPRAGLPAPTPYGQQTPRPQQPAQPEPRTPMNPGEPAWARGLTPISDPSAMPPPRTMGADVTRAMTQPIEQVGQQRFDQDIREMKGREAAAGGTPGERRGRIALGAILGGLRRSPDQISAALGPSPADRQAAIREQMAQMVAQRNEQQQTRQRTIAEQALEARRQANAERRFSIDEERNRQLDSYRDASLEQRGDQFTAREGQDMKQDALRGRLAQRRAETVAGGLGRGARTTPEPVDPSAPPPAPQDETAAIEQYRALNDMGVREIEAYISRRGVDTTTDEGRTALRRMLDQSRRYLESPDSRPAQAFWDNIRSSEGAARTGSNVDARLEDLERRQGNEEAERAIPGWQSNGEVRLRTQDASKIRELNASFESTRAAIGRIQQLRRGMSWQDFVSGAATGNSATGQELQRLSRQVQTYLRMADNMGVPTGREQIEARQQSPEAYSVQNLLASEESFRGLIRALALQHASTMRAWGLSHARGGQ
jgi:hypothetical protein